MRVLVVPHPHFYGHLAASMAILETVECHFTVVSISVFLVCNNVEQHSNKYWLFGNPFLKEVFKGFFFLPIFL